jgi:prevent-host-death family protein
MTKSRPAVTVGVHEAKTRLSELLKLVTMGQEIEIVRNGDPVARIVPLERRARRRFGHDEGVFTVPDDFDDPLPDEAYADFER